MEDKNKQQLQKWYSTASHQKSEPNLDWFLLIKEANKAEDLVLQTSNMA